VIRVVLKPEPPDFDRTTRAKGLRFLQRQPNPKGAQWKGHEYWRDSSEDLLSAYGRVCAYSCSYIPSDTGANSVDHFLNKDTNPSLAYEWANFRLVCGRLNGRKSDYDDVLDPFEIVDGWFVLDFPSLLVRPGEHLSDQVKTQVESTIKRLRLNDDDTCVRARLVWLDAYCQGKITIDFLRDQAPFIHMELVRQHLVDDIINMWSTT
jgi:hypothetical protein